MTFYGDQKFDAIVIGSGLGGLSCALHLARKGLKVLTLEKQPKVGGYAQNFQRGPYNFDVSLHIAPSLAAEQGFFSILKYLQVYDKLKIHHRQPMYRSSFPDRDYDFTGGIENTAQYLKKIFPHEATGIDKFLDICKNIVSCNFDLFWGNPVDVTNYFASRYFHKNYTELLTDCFKDQRLHGLFGQLWQSTGLPNNRCAANWSVEVMGSHLLTGNYYIEGGGGTFTQILANTLDEAGCPVLTCALVDQLIVENRHVKGVHLADGRIFTAPIVVSNAGPLQTYEQWA